MDISTFNSYIKQPANLLQDADISLIKEVSKEYPFFHSAHLIHAIAKNQTEGIFRQNDLKTAAIYSTNRIKLYNYLNNEKAIPIEKISDQKKDDRVNTVTIEKKEQNRKLIDKFIELNPSIKRPKAEFYSSTKMASRSIDEDPNNDFVTETLAEIHVKQNNYLKAIKIYKKLSLLNPEKSNYFAELIKNLKEKINE